MYLTFLFRLKITLCLSILVQKYLYCCCLKEKKGNNKVKLQQETGRMKVIPLSRAVNASWKTSAFCEHLQKKAPSLCTFRVVVVIDATQHVPPAASLKS